MAEKRYICRICKKDLTSPIKLASLGIVEALHSGVHQHEQIDKVIRFLEEIAHSREDRAGEIDHKYWAAIARQALDAIAEINDGPLIQEVADAE